MRGRGVGHRAHTIPLLTAEVSKCFSSHQLKSFDGKNLRRIDSVKRVSILIDLDGWNGDLWMRYRCARDGKCRIANGKHVDVQKYRGYADCQSDYESAISVCAGSEAGDRKLEMERALC